MKNAIIIGALGYIGYGLCCRLLDDDVTVYAVDYIPKESSLEEEKLLQIGRNANLQYLKLDEQIFEDETLSGIDVIYYTLIDPNLQVKQEEVTELKRTNNLILKKTIEYCEKNRCKFILLSTSRLGGFSNLQEENKLKEQEEFAVTNQEKLDYMIIRLPTIYGPWQPEYLLFQQAIRAKIENNQEMHFTIDEYTDDLFYIDDAIDGIFRIISNWRTKETFELSSGCEKQWINGIKIISESILNDGSIEDNRTNQNESDMRYFIQKPETSLEKGINNQIEYVKWLKKRHK